jgi:hypothetical protein
MSTLGYNTSTSNNNDCEQGCAESSERSLPEEITNRYSFKRAPLITLVLSDRTARPQQPGHDIPSYMEHYLLMLYLDKVIPYHFPFYNLSTNDGGRGWLFCLLMKCKPLRKAALAMAAVCCQQLPSFFAELTPAQLLLDIVAGVDHFYADAIGELGNAIGSLSLKKGKDGLKEGIEVLACIVHLVLLEVSLPLSR